MKWGGFSSRIIDLDTHSEIRNISKKADEFIEILENSGIKELHPDTYITYKNIETTRGPYYKRDVNIILTNPKIKKILEFGRLIGFDNNREFFQKKCKFRPDSLNNEKLASVFNKFTNFFSKAKEKFTPELLKDSELRMFIDFTDGIRPFRHKKANKLAPEFGLPSNWTEVLKKVRLKEKAEKKLAAKIREENLQKQMLEEAKRRKQFEEQNMEMIKEFLK